MIGLFWKKALIHTFTHELIQQDVKQETSLIAERRFSVNRQTGETTPLYEQLVMDEEYDYLFRRLFSEAQAQVLSAIPSRCVEETPTDLLPYLIEHREYDDNKDWLLVLKPAKSFPMQYRKALDSEIEGMLVDYICYRWLETKSAEDAAGYLGRVDGRKEAIRKILAKGYRAEGRWPSILP